MNLTEERGTQPEDKLLTAKNKWLIAHEEAESPVPLLVSKAKTLQFRN